MPETLSGGPLLDLVTDPASRRAVEDRLRRDGDRVRRRMGEQLSTAGYPAPFVDPLMDYPLRPAKGMRPMVCLTACRAFGGADTDALGVATAIELAHNSFLVSDDIADHAATRRGRPALHVSAGIEIASTVAPALFVEANHCLLHAVRGLDGSLVQRVIDEFDHLGRATVRGQAHDVTSSVLARDRPSYAQCLAMLRDKTSWYTIVHPLRLGAMLSTAAGSDLPDADALVDFGLDLGGLFQLENDLDNLRGAPTHDVEWGTDILEGKPTLPLIHFVDRCDVAQRRLLDEVLSLGRSDGWQERVTAVIDAMASVGSIEDAEAFADVLMVRSLESGRRALAPVDDDADRTALLALAPYIRGIDAPTMATVHGEASLDDSPLPDVGQEIPGITQSPLSG